LKLHLKKEHPEEYRLLDLEDKKKKEETLGKKKDKTKCSSGSSSFQPTLPNLVIQKKAYDLQSTKAEIYNKKLGWGFKCSY